MLAHASTTTTKIYTHPNFDLAMQYINQIPKYGLVLPYYAQLKIIKPEQTTLNVKQKPLNLRGPLFKVLVASVEAGEGFEPPTFRL